MMRIISIISVLIFFSCQNNPSSDQNTSNPRNLVQFSERFILDEKSGNSTIAYLDTLKNIDRTFLIKELDSDEEKIAFWINMYNSMVQNKLKKDSISFKNRELFFNDRTLNIAGEKISLNLIENGILRIQAPEDQYMFIKSFQPKRFDYRIHFALNCGAASCPPIAYYESKHLDKQLSLAEKSFISSNTSYDSLKNEIHISELFKWYSEDFGGEKGILELLKRHQIIPIWSQPRIIYTPYDWSIFSANYIQ